jgi:uncharacterized membrane protein YcaP (DUF421 family)
MNLIIRGTVIYFFLSLILRIGGRRSLAQITTFDWMLLLIIGEDDILTTTRELQGFERMEPIKYTVLERSGGISIIPKSDSSV